jgi:hypothetical protein
MVYLFYFPCYTTVLIFLTSRNRNCAVRYRLSWLRLFQGFLSLRVRAVGTVNFIVLNFMTLMTDYNILLGTLFSDILNLRY